MLSTEQKEVRHRGSCRGEAKVVGEWEGDDFWSFSYQRRMFGLVAAILWEPWKVLELRVSALWKAFQWVNRGAVTFPFQAAVSTSSRAEVALLYPQACQSCWKCPVGGGSHAYAEVYVGKCPDQKEQNVSVWQSSPDAQGSLQPLLCVCLKYTA